MATLSKNVGEEGVFTSAHLLGKKAHQQETFHHLSLRGLILFVQWVYNVALSLSLDLWTVAFFTWPLINPNGEQRTQFWLSWNQPKGAPQVNKDRIGPRPQSSWRRVPSEQSCLRQCFVSHQGRRTKSANTWHSLRERLQSHSRNLLAACMTN